MSSKYGANVPAPPSNAVDRSMLCGFDYRKSEEYWQQHGSDHQTFFIAGQADPPPDTVRLWEIWEKVRGSESPDLTPQPKGN